MTYTIDATCDGCSACANQCPVQAIQGVFKVRYDVDGVLCIDCGVCGAVCPLESVFDERGERVPRIPRPLRARPVVDPALCNGCAVCAAYCPFGCRQIVGPLHQGLSYLADPQRCVACGECARACIKGAIHMLAVDLPGYDPADERAALEALLSTGERP